MNFEQKTAFLFGKFLRIFFLSEQKGFAGDSGGGIRALSV
jgi:hypothetical protein